MDHNERRNDEIREGDEDEDEDEDIDQLGAAAINRIVRYQFPTWGPEHRVLADVPIEVGNNRFRVSVYRHDMERPPSPAEQIPLTLANAMILARQENVVEEMTRLSLVGYTGSSITGLTNEFVNLMDLNLHGVQLTSLEGFPALPNLRRLNLSFNLLYDGFELLLGCSLLQFLDISQNLIHGFDELYPLRNLINLQFLCVLPRRLRSPDEFHEGLPGVVFSCMPQLQYLDMRNRDGAEIEIEDIAKALGFQPI